MNKLKAWLMLLMMSAVYQTCADGCLKCDTTKKCLLCDISSFYINENGVCIKKAPENCILLSQSGQCLRCNYSYYYEINSKNCLKVPTKQQVSNCEFYNSQKECQICAKGFYLSEGKCEVVEIYVPGCLVHAKNTCIECDKGKILHPSRERCISSPQEDKCLIYGYLGCQECQSGFVLNSNYRIKQLFQQGGQVLARNFLQSTIHGIIDVQLPSTCEPVSVPNCEVFETFSKCKKCMPFYFLNELKRCDPYPLPSIPFCETYGNYNLCLQCIQGFKLNSPSECIAVKKIPNCKTYNPTTSANICTECEPDFYLFSNYCRERAISVKHCVKTKINNDECEECAPGYYLTDDFLKCLEVVSNCLSYDTSSSLHTQLFCNQCVDSYYLENQTCVVGQITNCRVYTDSLNCAECQNGFYYDNSTLPGNCIQHTDIEKCDVYSKTTAKRCDMCNNDSVLVSQKKACAKITNDISNCETYSTTIDCQECKKGYFLTNNTCQVILEAENCWRKNGVGCTECKEGYYLNNGACFKPFQFQSSLCPDWTQTDTLDTFQCNSCNQFTIPWNLGLNNSICATRDEIKGFQNFVSNIPNCLVHAAQGNTQICKRCAKDYYIDENETACVLNCPNQIHIDQKIDVTKRINKCVNTNIANCKKVVVGFNNALTCIECKETFIKQAEPADNLLLIDINPQTSKVTLGLQYLGFKCFQKQNGDIYETTQSQSPSPNCEAFTRAANGSLICTRCKFGFTGTFYAPTNVNPANLKCEAKIPDCDLNTYYGGLMNNVDQNMSNFSQNYSLINCHKCLTQGKIPFIFTDANLEIKKFSLEYGNEEPKTKSLYNSNWLQCLHPSVASFKMTEEQFASRFPKNCGFGNFLVDKEKDFRLFNEDYNSLRCLFCKPGFRPVYDSSENLLRIVDCIKIENCEEDHKLETEWFSSCSKCKPYHAWVFDQNEKYIRYDYCERSQDYNCLVVSNKNLQDLFGAHKSKRCLTCKPGFMLNNDGKCEKLKPDLCSDDEFVYDYSYMVDNNDIKNAFMLYPLFKNSIIGCTRCKENYEGFVWNTTVQVCLKSDYALAQIFPEPTLYIPHCKNYYLQTGVLFCSKCLPDFILLENKTECIEKQAQPNCLVVDNNLKHCLVCEPGFVRVLGFCEKRSIKYCKTYADNLDRQTCTVCEDTFALTNNHCYPGKVTNCQIYNQSGHCITCYDNFQFLQLKDTEYCVPVPETLNCTSYEKILNNDRELRCSSCAPGFVLSDVNTILIESICLNLTPVPNCVSYDNGLLLSSITLKCTSCEEGFYLQNNQCIQREVKVLNCKTYSPINDYCQACLEGFYITNKKECMRYPSGIYGCTEYENFTLCKSCQKHMYLSSNTCIKVPKKERIPNCDFYADASSCARCQFNYILIDNVCVLARANNCLEYENRNKCSACPQGFGRKEDLERGVVDCVYISTQNCLISKNVYPFDCVKCTKFYYNDQGRCFSNDLFIPFCDEYASRDTCRKCEQGFILSFDQKRCLSEKEFGNPVSPACTNSVQSQKPICYACEFGYKFYKNQCVQCKVQTLDSGCLYCEGIDVEVCLVCKPGYYQDLNGKCIRNGQEPSVPQVVDQAPETTETETTQNTEPQTADENVTQESQNTEGTTALLN